MKNLRSCSSICISSLLFFMISLNGVNGSRMSRINAKQLKSVPKLFVFGDSYADTGNLGKLGRGFTNNWYTPYGMTFPKKPSGRFSDGKVFTDFAASMLGIKSPIPYKYRKFGKSLVSYGMNFAIGGAGVLDTLSLQRNLSQQIDNLQAEVDAGVYTESDVKSSVALVVISGNDYSTLKAINPNFLKHIGKFMDRFFLALTADIERLQDMGIEKIIMTNMHPLSCIPTMTRSSNYTICPSNITDALAHHNKRLRSTVMALNKAKEERDVFLLDIFTPFNNIVHQVNGAAKFAYPMVPCCQGVTEEHSCGEEDENGLKLYTVCSDPTEHFYWDMVHPTQAGWAAVFNYIDLSLQKLFSLQ